MTARGKVKKLVAGILGAAVFFIIFGPFEWLLTALTYHPWRTCMAIAILLALYIWWLRTEYEDEPEASLK